MYVIIPIFENLVKQKKQSTDQKITKIIYQKPESPFAPAKAT